MQKNTKTISDILSGKTKKIYKFFFVGIGGVSMFSLASLMQDFGQEVWGSDSKKSNNTKELVKRGAKVFGEHKPENVVGCDFVVYSYAVWNNVEVQKAKELGIKVLSRTELLNILLKRYKISICVSGAHGKTTTTALIYKVLCVAGLKPSLHLGGSLAENGKCGIVNNGEIIVCEACEYRDAFLNLKPSVAVVLNVAPEHLDYFKTFNNVKSSFNMFAKSAKVLIYNKQDNFLQNNRKVSFGDIGSDYYADNVVMRYDGTYDFLCNKFGKCLGWFHINLIGEHNVQNALAATAVCDYLGIDINHIKKAFDEFEGVQRRFQILKNNPLIIHDYAHHPDEIKTVIKELKNFYKNKVLVIFQPHTYSRTKLLMNEFVNCFHDADDLALIKTYSAREKYNSMGSSKRLALKLGANCEYLTNKKQAYDLVKQKISLGYAVIFLGAGNINKLAENIAKLCWQVTLYMLNSYSLN